MSLLADRFEIVTDAQGPRVLGSGGMGRVYLAVDTRTQQKVALKSINIGNLDRIGVALDRARSGFQKEAANAMRIGGHPHIATVHDFFETDGEMWIAMEYIEGTSIQRQVDPGGASSKAGIAHPLAPMEALMYLEQAASAIVAMNGAQIVHRDIKPANLMLTERDAFHKDIKIIDFGLSKEIENPTASGNTFGTGVMAFTVHYASPEQIANAPMDTRSDIYSLGASFWFAMTGQRPFYGDEMTVLRERMQSMSEPSPAAIANLPEPIQVLLLKMMAENPDDRPQNGLELLKVIAETRTEVEKLSLEDNPTPTRFMAHYTFDSQDDNTGCRTALHYRTRDRVLIREISGLSQEKKKQISEDARLIARSNCPSLLKVYHVYETGIVTQWLPGISARALLRKRIKLTPRLVLDKWLESAAAVLRSVDVDHLGRLDFGLEHWRIVYFQAGQPLDPTRWLDDPGKSGNSSVHIDLLGTWDRDLSEARMGAEPTMLRTAMALASEAQFARAIYELLGGRDVSRNHLSALSCLTEAENRVLLAACDGIRHGSGAAVWVNDFLEARASGGETRVLTPVTEVRETPVPGGSTPTAETRFVPKPAAISISSGGGTIVPRPSVPHDPDETTIRPVPSPHGAADAPPPLPPSLPLPTPVPLPAMPASGSGDPDETVHDLHMEDIRPQLEAAKATLETTIRSARLPIPAIPMEDDDLPAIAPAGSERSAPPKIPAPGASTPPVAVRQTVPGGSSRNAATVPPSTPQRSTSAPGLSRVAKRALIGGLAAIVLLGAAISFSIWKSPSILGDDPSRIGSTSSTPGDESITPIAATPLVVTTPANTPAMATATPVPLSTPVEAPVVSAFPSYSEGQIGKKRVVLLPDGTAIQLCYIPPRSFSIGSPKSELGRNILRQPNEPDDETLTPVNITYTSWMAETETTQEQWKAIMFSNPSEYRDSSGSLPVQNVDWTDVRNFLRKLNGLDLLPEGWIFALPSEAEWEGACRAGTSTATAFGKTLLATQANFADTDEEENRRLGGRRPAPTLVKSFPPNAWGLYDMHGNVWEWVQDAYSPTRRGGTNPIVKDGTLYVRKGGGWDSPQRLCRSATRSPEKRSFKDNETGFRIIAVPVISRP